MKLLSVILSLNILVASTGVSLYTHICEAAESSAISMAEMTCENVKQDQMNCCSQNKACGEEQDDSDCCSSSGNFYKSDLSALTSSKYDVAAEPYFVLAPIYELSLMMLTDDNTPVNNTLIFEYSPGDASGTTMSVLQVFRC